MANSVLERIKSRFGYLLCYLLDEGFSSEQIEDVFIHDPYFQLFEMNDLEAFLETPTEDIVYNCFHKRIYIDYSKPVYTEAFWAGTMYITLLYNRQIPLQQSVLVIPIQRMIALFNPYHEMSEWYLCQRYAEEEKRQSILKALMGKEENFRKLAFLLGINERTLRSYVDNEKLFALSFSNAYAIANYFNVPVSVFTKKSAFQPPCEVLMNDNLFASIFIKIVSDYYGFAESELHLVANYLEVGEKSRLLQDYMMIVETPRKLIHRREKKPIVISDREMRAFYALSIERLKGSLPQGEVLF